jgi:P27 family predicted phage terminase small subunit
VSGPAPKPTRLRILEGNPSNRPLNDREPTPRQGEPDCPEWLIPEAQAEWARITVELGHMGLLSRADRAALAAYCQAWARWRQAEEAIGEGADGLTSSNKMGRNVSPEVQVSNKYLTLMKQYLAEFGLTPASRSKVQAPDNQGDDPFSDLGD